MTIETRLENVKCYDQHNTRTSWTWWHGVQYKARQKVKQENHALHLRNLITITMECFTRCQKQRKNIIIDTC